MNSKVFGKYTLTLARYRKGFTEIILSDSINKFSYMLSDYSHNGLILLLEQARIKIHGWG